MSKRETELSHIKHFGRVLRLAWRHKKYILIAVISMIGVSLAYTFSIGTMYVILNVLVEKETIHNMVDMTIVQKRLDVNLAASDLDNPKTVELFHGTKGILITTMNAESILSEKGVRVGNYIVSAKTNKGDIFGWPMVKYLATASNNKEQTFSFSDVMRSLFHSDKSDNVTVIFNIYSIGDGSIRPVEVPLRHVSSTYRYLRKGVSYIPAEPENVSGKERIRHRMTMLSYILVCFILLSIIGNICRFIGEYHGEIVGARTLLDIRRKMYAKVLMLPMSFFVTRNLSDTMSRFVQDSQDVLKALRTVFIKVLREPLKAIGVLIVAINVEPKLTIMLFFVVPIAAVIFRKFGRWVRKANEKLLRGYGRLVGALESTLSGIKVVKAYTMENRERIRYFNVEREILKQNLRIEKVSAMNSPVLEVLGIIALSGGMAWITQQIMEERLKVTDLLTLLIAMVAILDPVRKLSTVYTDVQKASAAAKRIFELIDLQTEFQLSPGTRNAFPPKSSIEFKNLVFQYPNSDHPAINEVSLKIEAGKIYAVVGPNGSGKTTLISLLLRLFDSQQGQILWDGVDIKEFHLRSLRKQMSYVSQDSVIFADSVLNNIAYGSTDSAFDEIVSAAKRAHAHEFIDRLQEKYNTVLGDHGTTLSGGERQRLSIARAILRNSPVLIFDEATSQIDAESEKKIQEAIDEFLPGRTAMVIAHRFSTIMKADCIVVMDRGKIVASGPHQELMTNSPLYQTLYETQLKGLQHNTGNGG